jgi:alpha-ketoglutarate-dependent taurine dioxygenase
MTFEAIDLAPRIGSLVKLDKAGLLSGEHRPALRALLEQRGVLVLRGIALSDEEEIGLATTLGTLRQDFGRPIMRVTFDRKANPDHADYFHATFHWHMDGTHEDVPPLASILSPRILAPKGTGHTEFASTYASWEDLPEAEKQALEGLNVAHTQHFALARDVEPTEAQLARIERLGTKIHPLVWRHRSGRKSLVLGASALYVVGMDRAESDALLARLTAWMTQPQYVYHHVWEMDDILMWDNTGTLHRVLDFDKNCGRRLHRVTLVGEEAFPEAA